MNNVVSSEPTRVLKALGFERPDVPPLALSLAMQSSRITNIPLPKILRDPEKFADAQLAMQQRWQHDITISMMYAASEAEAFGAKVTFFEDGPPNVGSILVQNQKDLAKLPEIDISKSECLNNTLCVIERMKTGLSGSALVCAVAVGPLSGPVMWMGMERWIEVLMTDPLFAKELISKYKEFSLSWARSQINAGADVLVWFEPFASTSMLPLKLIEEHAKQSLGEACKLGTPVVLHLASAPAIDTVKLAVDCGVTVLSIGLNDNPRKLLELTSGKLSLIGPLDGIGMHHWSNEQLIEKSESALEAFGANGGFILCDAHGEVPYQVAPEKIDHLVKTMRAK